MRATAALRESPILRSRFRVLATLFAAAVGAELTACASGAGTGGGRRSPAGGCARCRCNPHGSPAAFLSTHLSPREWRDRVFPEFAARPDSWVPVALASAALVARPFDDRAERAVSGALGKAEVIGDVGATGLVVTSLALGALRPGQGRSTASETWNQAEAFALTFGAVQGLKAVVGRHRPEGSSDRMSFPSGHTAAAFCAATLIAKNSGPRLGALAYGVATVTGLSRIEASRHFPSDVLAGAALGTLIAELVDILHFGDGSCGDGISSGGVRFEAGPTPAGDVGVGVSVGL